MRTLRILAIRAILATLAIGVCAIAIRSAIAQTPQPWPTPFPQVSPTPQMVPSGDVCEEPLIEGAMQMLFVVSANDEVELPIGGDGVDCTVYWGDCTTADVVEAAGDVSHTYAKAGTYTVQISGDLTSFGDGATWTGADMLTSVTTFGTTGITALPGAFYGASNLTALPESVTGVTDISDMLHDATSYNGVELATWDITSLTDAANALDGCGLEPDHYNQIIMSWADQVATNSDLPASITLGADGLWWGNVEYADLTHADTDTARSYLTTTASWTFSGDTEAMVLVFDTSTDGKTVALPLRKYSSGVAVNCTVYWGDDTSDDWTTETDCPHTWPEESTIYTTYITGALSQFGHISAPWQTAGGGAAKLKQCRSFGNVGLESIEFAFSGATNLIHIPNYFEPYSIYGTFKNTRIPLTELGNWDYKYTTKSRFFAQSNRVFNTYMEMTEALTDASNMYSTNPNFNQNLGSWQLRKAGVWMANMLNNCGMDTTNYARTLVGWANYVARMDTLPANVTFGAANIKYGGAVIADYADSTFTNAIDAKVFLTDVAGWSITDGGCIGDSCGE